MHGADENCCIDILGKFSGSSVGNGGRVGGGQYDQREQHNLTAVEESCRQRQQQGEKASCYNCQQTATNNDGEGGRIVQYQQDEKTSK